MALPIAAGGNIRNLGGYCRILFLGVALRDGAKEKLDRRCPVTYNLGREKAVMGFVHLFVSREDSLRWQWILLDSQLHICRNLKDQIPQ